MKIHIFDRQNDLKIKHRVVKAIVKQVLALEGASCDEVAVHFVDTQTIVELHKTYFDDASPTDCISFPIDTDENESYRILGEIFVCPKTALNYAGSHGSDPYFETTLYLVHGVLHLLGYDDVGQEEARMRKAEKRLMDYLQQHQMLIV